MKAEAPPSDVPLISVIVTVKDGELFVEQAMRAILAQTMTDFELIMVDDGSTDSTVDILHRLAGEDCRIRVLVLEKNVRQAAASNRGLDIARGEYIARTDADDIVEPRWLQTELDYLQAHPDVTLVGASMRHITADGDVIKNSHFGAQADEIRWQLRFMAPFAHNTIMFRRKAGNDMPEPRYDPDFRYADDYDFCARMIADGKGVNLPDILVSYRIHGGSLSQTKWHNQIQDAEIVATRFQKHDLPPDLFEALEPFRRAAFRFEPVPAADILRGLSKVLAHDLRRAPQAGARLKRRFATTYYIAMLRSKRSKREMFWPFIRHAPGVFAAAVMQDIGDRLKGRK